MKFAAVCCAFLLGVGCTGASRSAGIAGLPPPAPLPATRATAAPSTSLGAVASSAPVRVPLASPAESLRPAPLQVPFENVLAVPVRSIALGEGSRIAVLGDVPYVGDARGMRALPIPNALRAKPGETDTVRIFFGRDNEPRIMGSRRSAAGETSIYWRHTAGAWRDGRQEIGQLGGSTRGGLWGVLGSLDPELVCRVNVVCIIKRTSGWTTAPAGSEERQVELLGGMLWGLDASGLANIDAHGWALVIPGAKWSEPRGFWATSSEAWVATERALYHFHDHAWSEEATPIAEPVALWGTHPDSIWLVGKGGAAHFDGQCWRPLTIAGPLSVVNARSDAELWVGGAAGLFRVHPKR